MNGYLERLSKLNATPNRVEERVLLCTGQSSFKSSALSLEQLSFLETAAPTECSVLSMGFPFDSSFDGAGFREVGMVSASWRNARQVYWSMFSPVYREAIARRFQAVIGATSRRLIIVTGSCGLQLVNVAWPKLQIPTELRIDLVALGPACFGELRMPVTVVRGRRDIWSRMLYRGRVDHVCAGGHLDYWGAGRLVRALL